MVMPGSGGGLLSLVVRHTKEMVSWPKYTVSRHWANLRESAEFPTDVNKVVAMFERGTPKLYGEFFARYSSSLTGVRQGIRPKLAV